MFGAIRKTQESRPMPIVRISRVDKGGADRGAGSAA